MKTIKGTNGKQIEVGFVVINTEKTNYDQWGRMEAALVDAGYEEPYLDQSVPKSIKKCRAATIRAHQYPTACSVTRSYAHKNSLGVDCEGTLRSWAKESEHMFNEEGGELAYFDFHELLESLEKTGSLPKPIKIEIVEAFCPGPLDNIPSFTL